MSGSLESASSVGKREFSQSVLQSLLDVTVDGILVFTEAREIVLTNQSLREMGGWSDGELEGKHVSTLFSEESQRSHLAYLESEDALQRTLRNGKGLEVEVRRRDLSQLPVCVYAACLDVDGESLFVEVVRDISTQKQAELALREHQNRLEAAVERAEQRVIKQQEDLLELSTPVLEVWPKVLIMPLIGTLDSRRTEDALVKALERIAQLQAHVLIVDITGVPVVDTMVADHLIQMATAVRLMGATCVITGIRPVIAKTIVRLGVDLSNIITKSTLSQGLEFAINQQGGESR